MQAALVIAVKDQESKAEDLYDGATGKITACSDAAGKDMVPLERVIVLFPVLFGLFSAFWRLLEHIRSGSGFDPADAMCTTFLCGVLGYFLGVVVFWIVRFIAEGTWTWFIWLWGHF